eukprot:COSAG01_NODE_486_length_16379_cov_28.208717_17_plen_224_part_00
MLRGGAGVSGQVTKAMLQKTHFDSMRELGDVGISGGMDNAESESMARTVTEAAKQSLSSGMALGGDIDEGDPDEAVPEWQNDLQPASGGAKAGADEMPQMRVKASFYGCDLYDTDAVDRMELLTTCQSRKSAPAAWRPPQQAGTLTVEVDSCHDLLPGDTCDRGLLWLPDLCNIAGVPSALLVACAHLIVGCACVRAAGVGCRTRSSSFHLAWWRRAKSTRRF